MCETTKKKCKSKLLDPSAWGLSSEEVEKLSTRLVEFWERFASCFETQTRDTSHYALDILSGLLRMTAERNFTNLARVAGQGLFILGRRCPTSCQLVEVVVVKPADCHARLPTSWQLVGQKVENE